MHAEHEVPGTGDRSCALPEAGLTDRLDAWRMVAERAVSRHAEPGRVVSTYQPDVLGRLRELIAAEAECCPFLSFDVRQRRDSVEVEVRFPPEFAPMVSVIVGSSSPSTPPA